MKNKNLSWFAALLVFALLLWCTAATPGKIADPSTYTCAVYSTIFSLLPPVIAIVLALNTKEVYTSLLVGIASGALLYANGNLELAINTLFFNEDGGMVAKLSDSSNVGILVFLVMLGILVALMNKAGGSAAFGRWASTHIHSRAGAQFATLLLGVMIFVDDYFNCLTVGSVMRPVTDRQKVSRAKLAYLIDATAAPVCIIAPVSSWAAAVAASLKSTPLEDQSMAAFMAAIPWNFYAILTIALVVFLIWRGRDFGPMLTAEAEAEKAENLTQDEEQTESTGNGGLLEMIFPIALLLIFSFASLLYSGGFWSDGPTKYQFGAAIGASSSSSALCWAGFGTLAATILLYVPRRVLSFTKCMDGAVNGMKLMLPANIILVLAWTLSGICRDLLMSAQYVEFLVTSFGGDVMQLFPFICFAAACVLSFATGASWATFGILVPILVPIAYAVDPSMVFVVLGAVLAGSVFGDHSSPISDTSVLSAASSGCPVMEHAATQLPYALLTAFAAGAGYLTAGLTNGSLLLSWSTAAAVLSGGLWLTLNQRKAAVRPIATVDEV